MRRMVDKKELEGLGGGGGKLYCHCIKLKDGNANVIGVNLFNYSDVPFTISSFKEKLGNKELPCSGVISSFKGSTINVVVFLLCVSNGNLSCKGTSFQYGFKYLNISDFTFNDDVIPA